jgi:hypothetical protein
MLMMRINANLQIANKVKIRNSRHSHILAD